MDQGSQRTSRFNQTLLTHLIVYYVDTHIRPLCSDVIIVTVDYGIDRSDRDVSIKSSSTLFAVMTLATELYIYI